MFGLKKLHCTYLVETYVIQLVQELVEEVMPRQVAVEAVALLSTRRVHAVTESVLALQISEDESEMLGYRAEGMEKRQHIYNFNSELTT